MNRPRPESSGQAADESVDAERHGDAEHDDAERDDAEHDDAEHDDAEQDDAEQDDAGGNGAASAATESQPIGAVSLVEAPFEESALLATVRPGSRLRDRREHLDADRREGASADAALVKLVPSDPAIPSEILDRQDLERNSQDHTPGGTVRGRVSRWRRLVVVGAVLPAVVITYFIVSLFQVWSTGNSDERREVDAIVVMGAAQYDGTPSPQLAARLDHVATLWPEDLAPLVVVTGGNQPGDRFTEADASATYLMSLGVPEGAILRETTGSTSYESLEQVERLLADVVGDNPSVLIVTDPYHALRSELIAEEVGMDAFVSSTPTSVVTGARSFERHIYEAGGVAVGRITGFEWLSDITS